MSPVMINRSLAGEWVCPGDGVGMSGGLVYLGGYPRSHDMPPPKHVTKEYPSAPVLTPTGSPQNTCGWQAGGKASYWNASLLVYLI